MEESDIAETKTMTSDIEKKTDELIATIGRYVIVFQWIDAKLGQILVLWGDVDSDPNRGVKITKMTFSEKVDEVWREFQENSHNERGRARPEWIASFKALVARLHNERHRRNSLIHSYYLFDFLEIGEPVLKDDAKNGPAFVDSSEQRKILQEIAQLAFDVNAAHLQIIHDHDAHLRR